MQKMTDDEKLKRMIYVAGWEPGAVQRLLETCAARGFTPEEILAFTQHVFDSQCLSALRGGDKALDTMVAQAFQLDSQAPHPDKSTQ